MRSVGVSVFEDVVELWKQYVAKSTPSWESNDPRHDLSAEVRERLVQLDILLEYVRAALTAFFGDPAEARRDMEKLIEAKARLDAGEITQEDYFAGVSRPKSQEELRAFARAADEVRLFTETFYFVAWRLSEILSRKGSLAFSGFRNFDAPGVRNVRNKLIEHPERPDSGNFLQHIVVTDAGPVLKSSSMVLHSATGRTEPESESVDRGLFINAQELHDELVKHLRKELC
jgi:hypothetical protein